MTSAFIEERVLLTKIFDEWVEITEQLRLRKEVKAVEDAKQVNFDAYLRSEEKNAQLVEDMNALRAEIVEHKTHILEHTKTAEVKELHHKQELDDMITQLRTARSLQGELESLLSQRDFEIAVHTNRVKELTNDIRAREHNNEQKSSEIVKLEGNAEDMVQQIKTKDQEIANIALEMHTDKMQFLALKRDANNQEAAIIQHEELAIEREKQMEWYRKEMDISAEKIERLKQTPSDTIAKQVVQNSMVSMLEAKANSLEKQLTEAEEEIFLSSLHNADAETRPLVKELKYTRDELKIAKSRLEETEKESMNLLQNSKDALEKAHGDLRHVHKLNFQHQSDMVKVEDLNEEIATLKTRLEAMDIAYEELLQSLATLSSSPFGQKLLHKEWNWEQAAEAFQDIVKYGAKASFEKVISQDVINAVRSEMLQTLRANVLSVKNVKLDSGACHAFSLLQKSDKNMKTLFWGAGPTLDPIREDLMFWFLIQPWGTESAVHAHHLGAYIDSKNSGRYRLVVLKASVTDPLDGQNTPEQVTFDPFTVIPIGIVTYESSVILSGNNKIGHPLSYLRYTHIESFDNNHAANMLEEINKKMGSHGLGLTYALATMQTPYVKRMALEKWTQWKKKTLKKVAEREYLEDEEAYQAAAKSDHENTENRNNAQKYLAKLLKKSKKKKKIEERGMLSQRENLILAAKAVVDTAPSRGLRRELNNYSSSTFEDRSPGSRTRTTWVREPFEEYDIPPQCMRYDQHFDHQYEDDRCPIIPRIL